MTISDFANYSMTSGGSGLFGSTNIGGGGFFNNMALYKGFSEVNSIGYKRLLRKYFEETDSDGKKTEEKDSTKNKWENLINNEKTQGAAKVSKELKSDAASLTSAANELTAVDKEKNNIVFAKDRETIDSKVNNFITQYNDMVNTVAENSYSNTKMASLYNQLTSLSKASRYTLKDVGVNVNSNGTLTIDKETYNKADTEALEKVFGGKDSFAAKAAEKAKNITDRADYYAASGAYSNYTKNSGYNSLLGTGNLYNSLF